MIKKYDYKRVYSEFEAACKVGNLDRAKNIFYSDVQIKSSIVKKTFIWVCEDGHLEFAKWLNSLGIIMNYYKAFYWSCENARLKVAKWLYSLGGINLRKNGDEIFENACINGNSKLAKWLSSLDENFYVVIKNNKLIEYGFVDNSITFDNESESSLDYESDSSQDYESNSSSDEEVIPPQIKNLF